MQNWELDKARVPALFGMPNRLSAIEPLTIDVGRDFRYYPSQLLINFQDVAGLGSEKEKDYSLRGIVSYSALA